MRVDASSRTLVETLNLGYGAIAASHSCLRSSNWRRSCSSIVRPDVFGDVHPAPVRSRQQYADQGEHGGERASSLEQKLRQPPEQQQCHPPDQA